MSVINKIASIFSIVFIPLMIPTYALAIALWGTYLDFVKPGTKLMILGVVFAITVLIPALVIYVMHATGRIKDPGLNERKDRFIPIGVAMVTYVCAMVYLGEVHAPYWLSRFFLATIISAAVMLLVSTRWKISGHAMGVGGLCAFAFWISYRNYTIHNNLWILIATILIAGIVCSSRLILHRHTLAQVVAGFFNGALWITLAELI